VRDAFHIRKIWEVIRAEFTALRTLANELRTDHATFKSAADAVETLIEELHDDHATFRTHNIELANNVDYINELATGDTVLPHPLAAATIGCGLDIDDLDAKDVETNDPVIIRYKGGEYAVAAAAAVDTSAVTCTGDTIADNKFGVMWVYGTIAGAVDIETPAAAQSADSLVAALAQNMPTRPGTGAMSVPIGGVGLAIAALGGAFTIGTTALNNAAVTDTYYSFWGRPIVVSPMASFALDAAAATFTYGAAVGRLGTGTVITATGKANVTLSGSNVATGAVGAWRLFCLANDVEFATQAGAAYASLTAAQTAVENLDPNPLLIELGRLYVVNASGADFIPGTTNLDAAGITCTFEILGPQASNGHTDRDGQYVQAVQNSVPATLSSAKPPTAPATITAAATTELLTL
jgi:hypothetical protein